MTGLANALLEYGGIKSATRMQLFKATTEQYFTRRQNLGLDQTHVTAAVIFRKNNWYLRIAEVVEDNITEWSTEVSVCGEYHVVLLACIFQVLEECRDGGQPVYEIAGTLITGIPVGVPAPELPAPEIAHIPAHEISYTPCDEAD